MWCQSWQRWETVVAAGAIVGVNVSNNACECKLNSHSAVLELLLLVLLLPSGCVGVEA
jgi:hypothetical protein